jgi:hypothetical protein
MLAWIGTISSIMGSFLVALGIMGSGYICFITGSISWLIIAAIRRDKALGVLNGAFLIANIIGIVRYVI